MADLLKTDLTLNLQPDERVQMTARRHWVVLVMNEAPLVAVWLICSLVFLWRLSTDGFDAFNVTLFVLGSAIFLGMLYVYFDWRNDILVITSLRVIFQDATFLGQVQRNELYNTEIQDVAMTTESVIARQFNYGQINVQTVSRLRNIEFRGVAHPKLVRESILRNVDPLKKHHAADRVHRIVRSRVLGMGTPPNPPPPVEFIPEGKFGRGFLGIIPPSPMRRGDSVIWHKHWIFLLVEIADPLLLLLIIVTAWSLLRSQGLISGMGASLVLVLAIIGVGAWIVYEVVDWRDDEYIITPHNIIDIERTPLGRESKRETSWDRIEKVSLSQPNLLARILRYGNIELATAGPHESFTFRRVGSPNRVLAIVSDYRDHFERVSRDREFDSTLMLLQHYHELLQEYKSIEPPHDTPPQQTPPTQRLP